MGRILVGTCSWTDPTLVKETDWYPKKSMSAAERLGYYAARFPIAEADSTYYFPPSPQLARGWADRTPPGFTMDVKAYSLLTGHPAKPNSLWPDLRDAVKRSSPARPTSISAIWHLMRWKRPGSAFCTRSARSSRAASSGRS